MGYKASFSTTQKKKFQTRLRNRDSKVLVTGAQDSLPCSLVEQTTLRFLALKEISDDVKDDILLLTRYILDFFRAYWREFGCKGGNGVKRSVDDFAKKANIHEEQPLVGSYMEYYRLWLERPNKFTPYWIFFYQNKLQALKELTVQGNVLNIASTNQQTLSVDQPTMGQSYMSTARMQFTPQQGGHEMHSKLTSSLDPGMITRLKRILSEMLRKIMFAFIVKIGFKPYGDFIKEPKTNAEQPHGSTSSNSESIASRVKKRRRCSDENMNIEV